SIASASSGWLGASRSRVASSSPLVRRWPPWARRGARAVVIDIGASPGTCRGAPGTGRHGRVGTPRTAIRFLLSRSLRRKTGWICAEFRMISANRRAICAHDEDHARRRPTAVVPPGERTRLHRADRAPARPVAHHRAEPDRAARARGRDPRLYGARGRGGRTRPYP